MIIKDVSRTETGVQVVLDMPVEVDVNLSSPRWRAVAKKIKDKILIEGEFTGTVDIQLVQHRMNVQFSFKAKD